ncbi:MAG TPA: preprotein translocase subunit SecG [Erysipelothrix sp.]|jgi:preprotein translocase subunit SecG|nr:preprotein translocase subunit SecG [Erysipelothrix sp.]
MFLDILLLIVSAMMIILSLLQSGKSEGLSSAFTGGSGSNLFAQTKERGPEKVLSQVTMVVGVAYFVLAILTRLL